MFKNQPPGLIPAALSNMGERFGYYIMNAVLVLFLCSKFGLPEEQSTLIYSFFYAGIYVLSLVGGVIADRTQNYKGTIISGLIVMTAGYVVLAIPILATPANHTWLLTVTCVALFLIAFGNGLFKGNLQAIVGQLYDNPKYASQRDSGFQIFYVFINVGGLIAPFVAPMLRSWWLGVHGMKYSADLPAMCHKYLSVTDSMNDENLNNLYTMISENVGHHVEDVQAFCTQYLEVFNTGIHYSFIASVAAMLISLIIFIATKKGLPSPARKEKAEAVTYSAEERRAMAREIKQRMYALFAVLGIVIFFWFSFHQNGTSLSLFARDFVNTDTIAPEIWQAVNPFFVIVLTPVIMWLFASLSRRGREISTPRKIAIGMGLAGLAYLFLAVFSYIQGYPSASEFNELAPAAKDAMRTGPWVLILLYFFLTVAELFISPLGLSFVSKVAPRHMQGLCQGLWLGATAVGNLLLWIGPLMYNKWPIWEAWAVFFAVCIVSMGVMFGMVKWLERVTDDAA
ncbi:MAG: peptide MFS transporter [Candidatus Amulumruptor caecigallinarius]|nr:peptide MFS transporter [Candidatus Amulumruptor caecigallinarius]MCM1396745.1 peptide MFS transporter [Candidatus Amulumruptor caecigallinarius]MCM1453197.1 peptide MFS transporter [bacterium]